jgi:hypothetical protein
MIFRPFGKECLYIVSFDYLNYLNTIPPGPKHRDVTVMSIPSIKRQKINNPPGLSFNGGPKAA